MKLLFIASCLLLIGCFVFADHKSTLITSAEHMIKQAQETLLHHPNSRYEHAIRKVIADIEGLIKMVEHENDPARLKTEEDNLFNHERALALLIVAAGRDIGPQTERPPPATSKH